MSRGGVVQRIYCPKCGHHLSIDDVSERTERPVDEEYYSPISYQLARIPYCKNCSEMYGVSIDTTTLTITVKPYALFYDN